MINFQGSDVVVPKHLPIRNRLVEMIVILDKRTIYQRYTSTDLKPRAKTSTELIAGPRFTAGIMNRIEGLVGKGKRGGTSRFPLFARSQEQCNVPFKS